MNTSRSTQGNVQATEFYNNLGQKTRTVDADGIWRLNAYSTTGNLETMVFDMDRDGVIDWAGDDRIEKTTTEVLEVNNAVVRRTNVHRWDTSGVNANVLIRQSSEAVTTRESWGTQSGLTQHSEKASISAGSWTETTTNPDLSKQILHYTNGRLTLAEQKDGSDTLIHSTSYTYDEHGRLESVTDSRNGTTTYVRDDLDRITQTTSPIPETGQPAQVTVVQYDEAGQVEETTLPDNSVQTNVWNLNGTLQRSYGSQQYDVSYTYDPQGRRKTMTTATGVTTWHCSTTRGFLDEKVHADTHSEEFTYTNGGRLAVRELARGTTATHSYSNAGQLLTITYSDATPGITYTYNRLGQLLTVADDSGSRTMTQHLIGKTTAETYTAGTFSGMSISMPLDSLLRSDGLTLTQSSTTLHSVAYTYDAMSRLDTVTNGTFEADYEYHDDSDLVDTIDFSVSNALKMSTARTFDHLNRLQSIVAKDAAATTISSFSYDVNNLNQRTRVNQLDGTYWLYLYDSMGQVTSAKRYWTATNSPVEGQQYEYGFDGIGNRELVKTNGRSAVYETNGVNQIETRTVPGFLDILGEANALAKVTVNNLPTVRNGNYFHRAVQVNNAAGPIAQNVKIVGVRKNEGPDQKDVVTNQSGVLLVPPATENFEYDEDGNLERDGLWHYVWDGRNQLVEMRSVEGVPTEHRYKLTFRYDANGRRFEKQVFTWDSGTGNYSSSGTVTRFVYDGWNLIAELDGTNSMVRSYVWGLDLSGSFQGAGGVGGLLAVRTHGSNPGIAGVMFDGNGNVAGVLDLATQVIGARFEYDAFGKTIRATGSAAEVLPFRFSTKYCDKESGLYYYGYRYLDTSTGRWLNRDPIEEHGGVNLYGCLGNNTLSRIDLLGRDKFEIFTWSEGVTHTIVTGAYVSVEASVSVIWDTEECCLEGKIKFKTSGGMGAGWGRKQSKVIMGVGLEWEAKALGSLWEFNNDYDATIFKICASSGEISVDALIGQAFVGG